MEEWSRYLAQATAPMGSQRQGQHNAASRRLET